MMTGSYFICCNSVETELPEHFKVPHSIYVYIKQLENQIYKLNNPNCDIMQEYYYTMDSNDE
jgi:hypothetical protein